MYVCVTFIDTFMKNNLLNYGLPLKMVKILSYERQRYSGSDLSEFLLGKILKFSSSLERPHTVSKTLSSRSWILYG